MTTPDPRPLRVLVVDDNPVVLMALRNMLEIDGHRVSTAVGGLPGIAQFNQALEEQAAFDVVITDFTMPDVAGPVVARSIKASRAQTRVVMLTGGGPQVDAQDDWQAHVDDLLRKPPRLADLRSLMQRARAVP